MTDWLQNFWQLLKAFNISSDFASQSYKVSTELNFAEPAQEEKQLPLFHAQ